MFFNIDIVLKDKIILTDVFFLFSAIADVDYSQLKPHNRQPDDIVILPFSSGTTGLPKGVMLSHNNIAVNCEMLDVKLPDKKILRPTTADFQECSPSVLPFFHIYGLTVLMVSKLTLGTKVVTLPRFQPDTFMNSISEHGGTMLHLVPPIGECAVRNTLRSVSKIDGIFLTEIVCIQQLFSWAAWRASVGKH